MKRDGGSNVEIMGAAMSQMRDIARQNPNPVSKLYYESKGKHLFDDLEVANPREALAAARELSRAWQFNNPENAKVKNGVENYAVVRFGRQTWIEFNRREDEIDKKQAGVSLEYNTLAAEESDLATKQRRFWEQVVEVDEKSFAGNVAQNDPGMGMGDNSKLLTTRVEVYKGHIGQLADETKTKALPPLDALIQTEGLLGLSQEEVEPKLADIKRHFTESLNGVELSRTSLIDLLQQQLGQLKKTAKDFQGKQYFPSVESAKTKAEAIFEAAQRKDQEVTYQERGFLEKFTAFINSLAEESINIHGLRSAPLPCEEQKTKV